MSDDAWIQQSLGRLEALESHKAELEQGGYAVTPEVDAEISALYETLNSVASSEEGAGAPVVDPTAESHAAMAPAAAYGAGGGYGAAPNNPFAGAPAPMAAAAPMGAPPQMGMQNQGYGGAGYGDAGYGDASYGDASYGGDVDFDAPKSKAPIILAAVAFLAVAGGGGFWYVHNANKAAAAEPTAAGDPQVINASSIPEDTQEPDVAEGANVERTQGTRFKEGPDRSKPRSSGRSSGGGSRRSSSKSKDSGHKVKVADDSRDPLAGLK